MVVAVGTVFLKRSSIRLYSFTHFCSHKRELPSVFLQWRNDFHAPTV